jgi:hypothetical protein
LPEAAVSSVIAVFLLGYQAFEERELELDQNQTIVPKINPTVEPSDGLHQEEVARVMTFNRIAYSV